MMQSLYCGLLVCGLTCLMACSSQPDASSAVEARLAEPVVLAMSQDHLESFSSLPNIQTVLTVEPHRALLAGTAPFAVASGKWGDDTMAAFVAKYDRRPTVTILTARLPSELQQQAWNSGAQTISEPWYLYALPPLSQKNLEQARYLYSDAFQQSLVKQQLFTLPEPLRVRAYVALGLQPAGYEGGYR